MATYAPAVYTSVVDQVNYAFSFETIEQADVYVKVGENLTTNFTITNYTTSGGGTVVLTTAPEVGTEVTVFRDTDITSMNATFMSGSAIRAQDLNGDFTQLRNAIQETESNVDSIIQNPYELPVASDVTLGGIKVGDNLSITADGVLSSTDTSGVPEAPNDGKQYGRQSEAWTEITPPAPSGVTKIIAGTNVTISPTSGVGDVTINSTASGGGGGIPEAPQNGKTYGRKNAAWSEISVPTGGVTYKGTRDLTLTAPGGPSNGDFYINTATTGNCDASWTGIAGTALNGGERVVFNGSQWDLLPAEGGMWSQNGDAIYYNDGNVGIGTVNPSFKLDVNGTGSFAGNVQSGGSPFGATADGIAFNAAGLVEASRSAGTSTIFRGYVTGNSNPNVEIRADGTTQIGGTLPSAPNISLNANGDVEVARLAVDGSIATIGNYYSLVKNGSGTIIGGWTNTDDSFKVGGTLPSAPNISLNADGSATFAKGTLQIDYADADDNLPTLKVGSPWGSAAEPVAQFGYGASTGFVSTTAINRNGSALFAGKLTAASYDLDSLPALPA